METLATHIAGTSLPLSFIIATIAKCQFVLSKISFGRYLIAIGTNEEPIRLAGVRAAWRAISIFFTTRLGSTDPYPGPGLKLFAIAVVFIGGSSLMGGLGSIVHSFLGFLAFTNPGAVPKQIGTSESSNRIVIGAAIVLPVLPVLPVLRNPANSTPFRAIFSQ